MSRRTVNLLNEMPTSGQFIEINEYDGFVWAETRRWRDGILETYSHERDEFLELKDTHNKDINYQYISDLN